MNIQKLLITAAAASVFCMPGCSKDAAKGKSGEMRPVPVKVAEVRQLDVPVETATFGTMQPVQSILIKPQVTGSLQKACFTEGQDVRKGDVLLQIDPAPFEAVLKQARANLAKEEAHHVSLSKELIRQDELLKKELTSPAEYERAKAAADAAGANVASARAMVDTAEIQFNYCTIRSPVDGKTGELLVDEGNIVKANETPLLSINQIRPIEATFTLPEKDLAGIMAAKSSGEVPVKAYSPDADAAAIEGKLVFIDNNVDMLTGTVKMKALFNNEDSSLWPGQYVRLVVISGIEKNALTVPETAVLKGQNGTMAYVAKPDMSVEARPVTVARISGGLCIISKGLAAGENVITDGIQRINPKSRIVTDR